MRKVLIILLLISLCGCKTKDPLLSLGYSQEDIDIIKSYPESIQELFNLEYNDKYVSYMHIQGFDINRLDEYMKYDGKMSNDEIVKLVNDGEDIDSILDIRSDEYYIKSKEDIYLKYKDKYSSIRQLVEAINTYAYLPNYSNIISTDISKDYLMLVNKYHGLSQDYEPDDLVDVDPYYGKGKIRSEVYEQYTKMADEAFALGYSFRICSAYRSYDYQYGLYNKYLNEDLGGQVSVDTYSARPGHSEHQTGLCLDLSDSVYGMDNFGLSDSYKWIKDNCYKYGFIIRYNSEKENITGYQAEPWQIRYVGSSEIAKDIIDRDITFDEYYEYFVK